MTNMNAFSLPNGTPLRGPFSSPVLAGHEVPPDYIDFVRQFNGAHGWIGKRHLILFPVEKLDAINQSAGVERFAPGLVIFGSDGGGKSYAFDFRDQRTYIVEFYDADIGDEEPERCSDTFEGFLNWLSTLGDAD